MSRLPIALAVFLVALASALPSRAQLPDTDILLLKLPADSAAEGELQAFNVTNRPGYDNQPFFLPDGRALLYTSIREDGQADIYRYDLEAGAHHRVTRTPESEYSPTPLADGSSFSVVRVASGGAQQLWRVALDDGRADQLAPGQDSVGYHAWLDARRVALFLLGRPPVLALLDLETHVLDTVAVGVGRSLHRTPEGHLLFLQQGDGGPGSITRYDPVAGTRSIVAPALGGSEDFARTPAGVLLMARGAAVYRWDAGTESWAPYLNLEGLGFSRITRIAAGPERDLLALVVER